ncbi:MAG: TolC family protein [Ginsengibacter sp.]
MPEKCFSFFIILLIPFYSFAQDKTLDYYISNAVTNSPLLNDYRNQLLSNSIDSQILIASRNIQINGNGNSFYAPIRNGYGYDAAITNGGQLQALLTATKNILPKKFANLGFKDLQLTGDSIRNASKISEQDLKKTIINQYITTYGDQLQMNFNIELLNLLTREEIVLKKLTQKNVYKQVDYLSFLVTYQQQELIRNQLLAQYKNDYATLNYFAGIVDTVTTTLAQPELNVVKNIYTNSSAFFAKYAIDSLRLINNKALIDLGYRPHINLYADAGVQSTFMDPVYRNFGTSFGINFVIPIYDGGQKKLQYSKIDIAERTRLRNKEFFQNQYNQQVAQLQQQLSLIESLSIPINKQIKYIETLIEVNGKLLETGDIKMTDYILALNNYITSKNLVVQNMVARLQIINQLNYWNKK